VIHTESFVTIAQPFLRNVATVPNSTANTDNQNSTWQAVTRKKSGCLVIHWGGLPAC